MSGGKAAQPRQIKRQTGQTDPRQQTASRPAAAAGYTIAHAGRQIRLGPVAFWIFVGTVVIMASWSVATATYFAFRNDLLKGLIARQAEQQYAYEDRIAELRARIDRTTSRQLLDQEQFEQKLDDLSRRQTTLESHAAALVGIVEPPDDKNLANPPSNRALIDYLASEFIRHDFDLKWLHREITMSRTYQLSWKPNDTNRLDTRNFSRAWPRRRRAAVRSCPSNCPARATASSAR